MTYRYFPNQLKINALAIAIGVALTGCFGATDHGEQAANQRLDLARVAYAQAKANPQVEAYSLRTLQSAEKSLQEAEKVREGVYTEKGIGSYGGIYFSKEEVLFNDLSRLSYISERKSQTSVALAEGVVARDEIVKLGRERAEVQLLKSQVEQQLLQRDLAAKVTALELVRQQLVTATNETERARIIADIQAQEAALAKAEAYAEAREADWARALAVEQARAAVQAKTEAEVQTREAEKAKAELALLLTEMSELQGQLTDRGIVLTIGDVLFATGKSDLNASAQRSMGKLADFLQKKQNRNLLVEGHTDNVGEDFYNQGLSEQRAAAVKFAMVNRGIAGDRIVTIGYGKNYPLTNNNDAIGKQQNRRVEAIILNEGVLPESQFRN
ncbi:MAG: OmpA family protein [Proteobacteria bacterium]|nr:OmpA family protein [Pseudomonadota bacterium]MBU1715637.1 OmpA family protein [Pseudomonadota bacterium]